MSNDRYSRDHMAMYYQLRTLEKQGKKQRSNSKATRVQRMDVARTSVPIPARVKIEAICGLVRLYQNGFVTPESLLTIIRDIVR